MIDPTNITNYNLTDDELEEHILFWVCAAGKNGVTAAKCLNTLLQIIRDYYEINGSPFQLIKHTLNQQVLAQFMHESGIGCYNIKSKTFFRLANSKLDLRNCTVDHLENIFGIGPKTARCFLIHSRPNQKLAGLDTHILKFLADKGYNVPKSTPTGNKYKQIEQWFLTEVNKSGKDVATFDLEIWNRYRTKS